MSSNKFYNLPKKYPLKEYNDSIKKIVKKYSDIKNLESIYEWGSVSQPGISDIDIVLVFGKSHATLPISKRSFNFTDKKTRYLTRHPFIFIGKDSFHNIKYVNHHVELKLLFGKKFNIRNLTSKEQFYVKTAVMNDLIIRHYPRDFLSQQVEKNVNVRDTLLRLNSLRYTIQTMETLTGKRNKTWNSQAKEILNLRKDWFKKNDFNLLVKLNEEAVDMTMEIIQNFKDFLTGKKLVRLKSKNPVKYNGAKNKSLFVRDWNRNRALKEMVKNPKKSILPLELAPQLIEYSKYKGEISSYVRKSIKSNLSYDLKYKDLIKRRISILNNQAELANKLKHSDFPAFFDFGYRTKSGVNNWILNILDRIRY